MVQGVASARAGRASIAFAVPLALLLATALVAAAASSAPKLTPRSDYSGGSIAKGKINIDLVSRSATQIVASPAGGVPVGSNFALSLMFLHCTKLKLADGEPSALGIPVPALKLRKRHGRYGFSASYTRKGLSALGVAKTITAKVKLSGTVVSPTLISGTVRVKGGACGVGSERYAAKLNKSIPVAPNA
jgi:hypothetical protein